MTAAHRVLSDAYYQQQRCTRLAAYLCLLSLAAFCLGQHAPQACLHPHANAMADRSLQRRTSPSLKALNANYREIGLIVDMVCSTLDFTDLYFSKPFLHF
jgi:hypothetical protein